MEKEKKKVSAVCFFALVLFGGYYSVSHGEKAVRQKNSDNVQKSKILGDNYVKPDVEIKSVWEKTALPKYGGKFKYLLYLEEVVFLREKAPGRNTFYGYFCLANKHYPKF